MDEYCWSCFAGDLDIANNIITLVKNLCKRQEVRYIKRYRKKRVVAECVLVTWRKFVIL